MAEAFKFELVSPERLVISEMVTAVVVPGVEGDLTVLKDHAPFMTTLRPGFVTVEAGGKQSRVFVRGGFADVSPTGLTILAEKAMPADEFTGDVAAAEIKAAETDAAEARGDEAVAAAQLRLNDVRLAAGSASAAAH